MSQLPAYKAYIEGAWQSAQGGEEFKVFEPYMRKPIARRGMRRNGSPCGHRGGRKGVSRVDRGHTERKGEAIPQGA